MTKRKLTVEEHHSDQGAYRHKSCPKLRIKGRWLEAAGFPPGSKVELTVCSPGVIEIRLCAPPQLRGEAFTDIIDRLTAATAQAEKATAEKTL